MLSHSTHLVCSLPKMGPSTSLKKCPNCYPLDGWAPFIFAKNGSRLRIQSGFRPYSQAFHQFCMMRLKKCNLSISVPLCNKLQIHILTSKIWSDTTVIILQRTIQPSCKYLGLIVITFILQFFTSHMTMICHILCGYNSKQKYPNQKNHTGRLHPKLKQQLAGCLSFFLLFVHQ